MRLKGEKLLKSIIFVYGILYQFLAKMGVY